MKKYALLVFIFFIKFSISFSQTFVSAKYRHFDFPSICRIVEVIDARQDKDNIGLIIDEKNKRIDTVKFENKIEDYLKDWLEFSTVESHFKYSLALKVNYLEFNKREVNNKIRYWLFYDIELYVKNADNSYTKVYDGVKALEASVYYENKNDTDAEQFGLLNWHFWNDFQNDINFIKYKNILKNANNQALSEINKTFELAPIFGADSLQAGSYETFAELINNEPKIKSYDIKESIIVITDPLNKNNIRTLPVDMLIGYSDGKQVFINHNKTNQFYGVERLGTVFEATGYAKKIYNIKDRNTRRKYDVINLFISPIPVLSTSKLLINLIKDATNSRFIIDTRQNGEIKKMPYTILK